MNLDDKAIRLLCADKIPADFPQDKLVTPRMVILKTPDGFIVHGNN